VEEETDTRHLALCSDRKQAVWSASGTFLQLLHAVVQHSFWQCAWSADSVQQ
jgi:hypothetical protein